jgi:hypothetical protein
MDRDFALLIAGGAIALISSVVTALLQHHLSLRADRIRRDREQEEERAEKLRDKLVVGIRGPTADVGSGSLLRRVQVPTASATRDAFTELKLRVQSRIIAELDPSLNLSQTDEARAHIGQLFDAILKEEGIILSRAERVLLFEQILDEILCTGLDPDGQESG